MRIGVQAKSGDEGEHQMFFGFGGLSENAHLRAQSVRICFADGEWLMVELFSMEIDFRAKCG